MDDKRTCKSNVTTTTTTTIGTTKSKISSILNIQQKWSTMPLTTYSKVLKKRTTRSSGTDDNELIPRCPTGYRYNADTELCDGN